MYVPLTCKTNFSFLEGASHPAELVIEADRLGLRSIAITDRDGVYGIVRAHIAAREAGMNLICGAEISVIGGSVIHLLAADRRGYANLCRLISKGRLRSPKGFSEVNWPEVCANAEGLLGLWGGGNSLLSGEDEPDATAKLLRDAFGDRLYALVTRHKEAREARQERRIRERAARYEMQTVASVEVLYHTKARQHLQDVLTCIRSGVTLFSSGAHLHPNAERYLHSPAAFKNVFNDDIESLHRTNEVAERCKFSLGDLRYCYPSERMPNGVTSGEWLRTLAFAGARERYGATVPEDVRRQLDKELSLIHDLDYEGYFLTMCEIVQFCRHKNILCQGRGSAANSAVCYCLGITAVDPIRMGLLFERFLSRERAEPPDIDLDIEHDRREEAIQHLYAKHGRTHAAMVANVIRYRARSAVREVGKVFGISPAAIEKSAKLIPHYGTASPEALRAAGLETDNPIYKHFFRLSREIEDVPRHLSIHPGGFILGHEPIDTLVPVENATMPDRTVIQWDKRDVEDLGLFKVDLLGLGALNAVHRSFDLIEQHCDKKITLATIPPEDPDTYEMIRRGDTVGTFQIESRAQMAMLPRLKPMNYYDLVISISIVRPGPITGGMVNPYLKRRNGEEEVVYPHELLRPILEKTLGIPLFQEQVMQLAMAAADYTPGEADQLRRDMAWMKEGRIERHEHTLISRMIRKGIPREFAEKVFKQIRGFGEYGFPESHAASFALIAYATAWLKRHYPAAFLCAMLNAQPMGFYSPATLIGDARRHGVVTLPIDVQTSERECTLESSLGSGEGYAVRIGLRYVKGLSGADAESIVAGRDLIPYSAIDDLAVRARLNEGPLSRLAESGALASLDPDRRSALWTAFGTNFDKASGLDLSSGETKVSFNPLTPFQEVAWDYNSSSHSTRGHPLAGIREELTRKKLPDAASVAAMSDGQRVQYAGMVICRQRPGTAKGVTFMTLEDETGFVNLVIWDTVFRKYELLAKTASFLGVTGKLQSQSGVVHIVAEKFWTPAAVLKPTEVVSRDFH